MASETGKTGSGCSSVSAVAGGRREATVKIAIAFLREIVDNRRKKEEFL